MLRHFNSFEEGIKKRIKTPIRGVIEVRIRGLKNSISNKITIFFIYRSRLIRTTNLTLIKLQLIKLTH